ncbi:MAG: YbhB/YbcL family Raf kinase inhibitor-like protein [Planctomycetes bacterium]|nr:YbhB/YbcL family Raf kinase inhibitor-like protein [Planctomycetota bacterium]
MTSTSFKNDDEMPVDYTEDGLNKSPAISWADAPAGTRSFALICDDPDAPQATPFVHWVVVDIPAAMKTLPEGISKSANPREIPGATQGVNDFRRIGYDGPAPPRGHGTHHYHFHLYALNAPLKLAGTITKDGLLRAMRGHVLGTGEIVATYRR